MHPAEVALVDFAMERLAVVSGTLSLVPAHRVCDGFLGEFNETSGVLTVATADPEWSGVLAHELGHVEQCIERRFAGVGFAQQTFEDHLAGKSVPPRRLLRAVRQLQRMELDAERYALRMIGALHLPVDRLKYVKNANAYVLSFEWARRHGRWPGSAWPLCPARLVTERGFCHITPELESAFGSKNSTPG